MPGIGIAIIGHTMAPFKNFGSGAFKDRTEIVTVGIFVGNQQPFHTLVLPFVRQAKESADGNFCGGVV